MSSYNCEFCNNEYSSKKSLDMHKKTAKFCLKIQKSIITNTNDNENTEFACEHCMYKTTLKSSLIAHGEICKIRLNKIKEEHEKKKDDLINKLQNELNILMTQTYPERENKYKEEINIYKTELRIKEEQVKMKDEQYIKELKMKDDIISKLEKENESLKQENKDTFMTLLDRSDKTYDKFFEKEEKLVDTLLQQNSIKNNLKTINNLTINNYGIKPITSESVINAFESYNSKQKNAFNAFQYDGITLERGSMKVEYVFYDIIKELKDYYGITDVSREKIIFNNNGEMTLTTVQEFIKTNVVMNNIDSILEWISNLLSQIKQRIYDGKIEIDGEMRDMTEIEKNKLSDTGESLEYIYKLFKISKEKGTANTYMTKLLSEGAMENGKVVGKIKQLK